MGSPGGAQSGVSSSAGITQIDMFTALSRDENPGKVVEKTIVPLHRKPYHHEWTPQPFVHSRLPVPHWVDAKAQQRRLLSYAVRWHHRRSPQGTPMCHKQGSGSPQPKHRATMLVIGDSIIQKVHVRGARIVSLPCATVTDITENLICSPSPTTGEQSYSSCRHQRYLQTAV